MSQSSSYTQMSAADAHALFKGKKITVQEAKPVKVKGEDGKVRDAFKTSDEDLAPHHILSAKDHGRKASITTIDGRRYETEKPAGKSADGDKDKK